MSADLLAGREAFERRRWPEAAKLLSAADKESPLECDDLEHLAAAAYLAGADEESDRFLTRAHHEALERGDLPRAARHAFWLGFGLASRGELAQAGGWFGRAQRVVDECGRDCVEEGYVLVPLALHQLESGDADQARELFARVIAVGTDHGDVDLTTLGRVGIGRARIAAGESSAGIAILDEAMVAVTADEVSPIVAGVVYCAVIEACTACFDVGRAQEWTEALTRWCAEQPGLVPYRGQCLVHRSQVLLLRGEWHDAIEEVDRARALLSRPHPRPAVGAAWYQRAELHRLRGEFADAQRSYQEASRWGCDPQPGLALLRLAEGNAAAAVAAVRRAAAEATAPPERARVLPAVVDVLLATGDLDAADAAADELGHLADDLGAPLLRARAAYARGALGLARGDARAALEALHPARATWQELNAPFESARTRVLTALACQNLGDEDTALVELAIARRVFEELGARPELARLPPARPPSAAGGEKGHDQPLTAREAEVLRLLSAGKTNKAIAADLVVSARTVDRHVSNIFTKLGVSSRAAATAWAYEHGVV